MCKRSAIITWLLLFIVAGYAQTSIGVVAGGNLSDVTWKQFSQKRATRLLPGYQFGVTVTTPATIYKRQFHLQPAIFFSRKGFQQDYNDYLGKGDYKVAPYYLEIPVNLVYVIPNRTDNNVFVGAGSYIGWALGGQWEIRYQGGRGNFVGDIEFADIKDQRPPQAYIGDDTFNYGKKLDYGMHVLMGYELWGNLQARVHGQLGLRNLAPSNNGVNGNEYFKNLSFGLSLGYLL